MSNGNDSWGQVLLDRIADSEKRLARQLTALEAAQAEGAREVAAHIRTALAAAREQAPPPSAPTRRGRRR